MNSTVFPDASNVPTPRNNGLDAKKFLEHHGIVAVVPPIRSSQLVTARSNPLLYYLQSRLGLVHGLDYNEALSKGSWAHTALQYDALSSGDLQVQLHRRKDELKKVSEKLGTSQTWLDGALQREEEDMKTTVAWLTAYREVPVTPDGRTITKLLEDFQILGSEVEIRLPIYDHETVVAFDQLLYHKKSKELWILDLKTCSESVDIRLATAPWEFQTLLYLYALLTVSQSEEFWKTYPDVDPAAKVGGMIHWACQKPSIRLSGEDRDFTWSERTLKSGPNKGQVRREKVYEGEPTFENYLRRVRDWALADGYYLHERASRQLQPVTDLSYTALNAITEEMWAYFRKDYEFLKEQATLPAYPANYPPVASEFRKYRTLSKYSAFMAAPVQHWPEIIANEGFTISHRSAPVEIK